MHNRQKPLLPAKRFARLEVQRRRSEWNRPSEPSSFDKSIINSVLVSSRIRPDLQTYRIFREFRFKSSILSRFPYSARSWIRLCLPSEVHTECTHFPRQCLPYYFSFIHPGSTFSPQRWPRLFVKTIFMIRASDLLSHLCVLATSGTDPLCPFLFVRHCKHSSVYQVINGHSEFGTEFNVFPIRSQLGRASPQAFTINLVKSCKSRKHIDCIVLFSDKRRMA